MIKKVYIYVVAFATLMMTIGGGIGVFSSLANYYSQPTYYMAFNEYVQSYHTVYNDKGEPKQTDLSETQLKEEYQQYIEREEENEKKRSINNLIQSLGWILIPFPIFLYAQKQIKKEGE